MKSGPTNKLQWEKKKMRQSLKFLLLRTQHIPRVNYYITVLNFNSDIDVTFK